MRKRRVNAHVIRPMPAPISTSTPSSVSVVVARPKASRYIATSASPEATKSASVCLSPVSLLNTHPVAWTTSSALC
jgi:hypothetical protein